MPNKAILGQQLLGSNLWNMGIRLEAMTTSYQLRSYPLLCSPPLRQTCNCGSVNGGFIIIISIITITAERTRLITLAHHLFQAQQVQLQQAPRLLTFRLQQTCAYLLAMSLRFHEPFGHKSLSHGAIVAAAPSAVGIHLHGHATLASEWGTSTRYASLSECAPY